jgi:hypothetical protein
MTRMNFAMRLSDRRAAPRSDCERANARATGGDACGARVGPRGTTPDMSERRSRNRFDPEESWPEACK